MAGVYCPRCETNVLLEQDGRSCSNCGTKLVTPTQHKATSRGRASDARRAHAPENAGSTPASATKPDDTKE